MEIRQRNGLRGCEGDEETEFDFKVLIVDTPVIELGQGGEMVIIDVV